MYLFDILLLDIIYFYIDWVNRIKYIIKKLFIGIVHETGVGSITRAVSIL